MKTILLVCLAIVSPLTALASEKSADQKAPDDQKALQGDWIPVKAELAGQPMPEAVLKMISLKLIKNEYEVLVGDKPDKGTWTIDVAAKPKSMKIVGVKGPNKGKTFPAIYELDGDTLRVCYDLSGKKLPTEFKTKADTKLYLVTYKRKNGGVADKPAESAGYPFDENSPGVGPIRTEPAFQNLWRDRRAMFARQNNKQQHALVFFGDSITQGWGDDFKGKFPELKVANRGISGDTTRGLLARVDADVLALNPCGIVLMIGVNDVGLKVPPEGIADNVKLLLAKIAAHDAKIPIILCQVMPTSPKQGRPTELIRKLNQLLAEAARGNEQVTVLDTFTLFANPDGDAKPEEFSDLVHPNDIGYAKWRAALWPLLATLGLVDKEADAFTPEPGFEPLFDGHDLGGWGFPKTSDAELANLKKRRPGDKKSPAYPVVHAPVTFDGKTTSSDGRFRAIGGRLVVTTPTEGRRIQQLATTRDFSDDFTLKLDFRATPNADSGVFVRGRQIQCRDYLLAGPYKNLKNYKPQDWNELVIEVKGNKAHCTCNGEVLEAAYEIPASGPIGLEGDRGQMEYRHIRIHHN